MATLLLPPRYTEDTIRMGAAARAAGWRVARIHGWRAPDRLRAAEPVIYGEPLFGTVVAEGLGLALLEPPFDWLTTLPEPLVGRRVRYLTLGQARSAGRAFVKPADDKRFEARVYGSGAELPPASLVADDAPVLLSEPVHWRVEFRCFVLERRLMTLSPYAREGRPARDADGGWPEGEGERAAATRFVEGLLGDAAVPLPPSCVVDVGIVDGHGWAVVEANPAWGSGIYGCDPAAVLQVIRRATVPRAALTDEDRRWLPVRRA